MARARKDPVKKKFEQYLDHMKHDFFDTHDPQYRGIKHYIVARKLIRSTWRADEGLWLDVYLEEGALASERSRFVNNRLDQVPQLASLRFANVERLHTELKSQFIDPHFQEIHQNLFQRLKSTVQTAEQKKIDRTNVTHELSAHIMRRALGDWFDQSSKDERYNELFKDYLDESSDTNLDKLAKALVDDFNPNKTLPEEKDILAVPTAKLRAFEKNRPFDFTRYGIKNYICTDREYYLVKFIEEHERIQKELKEQEERVEKARAELQEPEKVYVEPKSEGYNEFEAYKNEPSPENKQILENKIKQLVEIDQIKFIKKHLTEWCAWKLANNPRNYCPDYICPLTAFASYLAGSTRLKQQPEPSRNSSPRVKQGDFKDKEPPGSPTQTTPSPGTPTKNDKALFRAALDKDKKTERKDSPQHARHPSTLHAPNAQQSPELPGHMKRPSVSQSSVPSEVKQNNSYTYFPTDDNVREQSYGPKAAAKWIDGYILYGVPAACFKIINWVFSCHPCLQYVGHVVKCLLFPLMIPTALTSLCVGTWSAGENCCHAKPKPKKTNKIAPTPMEDKVERSPRHSPQSARRMQNASTAIALAATQTSFSPSPPARNLTDMAGSPVSDLGSPKGRVLGPAPTLEMTDKGHTKQKSDSIVVQPPLEIVVTRPAFAS